jgi:hypothetical protein
VGNVKERENFEKLDIDRKILNGYYRSGMRWHGLDACGSEYIKWWTSMKTLIKFRFS